MGAARIELA